MEVALEVVRVLGAVARMVQQPVDVDFEVENLDLNGGGYDSGEMYR